MDIDAKNNRIVVGKKEKLFSGSLIASDLNLLAVDSLDQPCRILAKIRLNHRPVPATVYAYEKGKAKLIFDEPEMAVTPGQSVVMYSNDIVFGGGIINKVIKFGCMKNQ
jgi:tRNA-specific 2-thiouridylase